MRVIAPWLLGFGLALGPAAPADGAQVQPDDTLAITVTNSRTGFSHRYGPREQESAP